MPALFNDIGKKSKDLFSKKYDYKNEIKTINKAKDGLKIEAGLCYGKGVAGSMKGTYKTKDYEAEVELNSCEKSDDKAKVSFGKLVDNLDLELTASSSSTAGLAATYKMDSFVTKLEVDHSSSSTAVKVQGSVGFNDFVAGVGAAVDATNANFDLKDYNFGAQYTHGDIVAALKTAKGRNDVSLSVVHKLSSSLSWGTSLMFHPSDSSRILGLGMEYELSKVTSVKSMADSAGAVAFAVEHKLANPNVKVNLAAQFNVNNYPAPAEKFGMSLVFGDY